jgi:hypothetical protein
MNFNDKVKKHTPPKGNADIFSRYFTATGNSPENLDRFKGFLTQLAEAESYSGKAQSSDKSTASGYYHYLDDSTKTSDNRLKNLLNKYNVTDPDILNMVKEYKGVKAGDRPKELQDMMVLADLTASPNAPLNAWKKGEVSNEELYYKGHHTADPNAISSQDKVYENWNNAGKRLGLTNKPEDPILEKANQMLQRQFQEANPLPSTAAFKYGGIADNYDNEFDSATNYKEIVKRVNGYAKGGMMGPPPNEDSSERKNLSYNPDTPYKNRDFHAGPDSMAGPTRQENTQEWRNNKKVNIPSVIKNKWNGEDMYDPVKAKLKKMYDIPDDTSISDYLNTREDIPEKNKNSLIKFFDRNYTSPVTDKEGNRKPRSIPPMGKDSNYSKMQDFILDMDKEEVDKLFTNNYDDASIFNIGKYKPKGMGYLDMASYLNTFRKARNDGYTFAQGGKMDPPPKEDNFNKYFTALGNNQENFKRFDSFLNNLETAESYIGEESYSKDNAPKGAYHYSEESAKTSDNRIRNLIKTKNITDPKLLKAFEEQLALPVGKREPWVQKAMVASDFTAGKAPLEAWKNKLISDKELYYKGHHVGGDGIASEELLNSNWDKASQGNFLKAINKDTSNKEWEVGIGNIPNASNSKVNQSERKNPQFTQYTPPSFFEKVNNRLSSPFTTFGYAARNEPIPDYIPINAENRNAFDQITDLRNPAAWLEYGEEAYKDIYNGDYVSAAVNAINAIPSTKAGAKVLTKADILGEVGQQYIAARDSKNPSTNTDNTDKDLDKYHKTHLDNYKKVLYNSQMTNQNAQGGMINSKAGGGHITGEQEGHNAYNEGGLHEQNPHGGIPQGMGANGKMNTVEEGETSAKLKQGKFIFSNRIQY